MRSDLVKKGSTRAAHRSLFYALGFSDEDLKKPLIAVVNSQTDIIAGHAHLDDQAKMVKYSCHRPLRRYRHGPRRNEIPPGKP